METIKVKHTFLYYEGLWTTEGFFYDEIGTRIPQEGTFRITHSKKYWINESRTKQLDGEKKEFKNTYEIIPFEKFNEVTIWRSQSSSLGVMSGTFTIVDDSIVSVYSSEKDNYTGTEYFLKMTASVYKNRGCLFKGSKKISSWSITLFKFD